MRRALHSKPTYPVEDYEEMLRQELNEKLQRFDLYQDRGPSWPVTIIIIACVMVGGFIAAWMLGLSQ